MTEPSVYACPECHGVLMQVAEGERVRFRCHTGHAYSLDTLLAAITDGAEAMLWNAIRALEETAMLIDRMARHFAHTHDGENVRLLTERRDQARRQADVLRNPVHDREAIREDA